eukprot:scaffold30655_cov151-Amphora_coffeaeformis.AAC.2
MHLIPRDSMIQTFMRLDSFGSLLTIVAISILLWRARADDEESLKKKTFRLLERSKHIFPTMEMPAFVANATTTKKRVVYWFAKGREGREATDRSKGCRSRMP